MLDSVNGLQLFSTGRQKNLGATSRPPPKIHEYHVETSGAKTLKILVICGLQTVSTYLTDQDNIHAS